MKHLVQKIKNNQFINASFYSAISSIIKIITSLLIGKLIANLSGAEGMVLYGQLLSFVVILNVFSGGAINQGITKYVAQYNVQEEHLLPKVLSTSLKITFYLSLSLGLLIVVFSKFISKQILYDEKFYLIFVIYGFTITFFSLNNFLLSVLNGFKEYKKFNVLNIILNLSSLIVTLILSYTLDVIGTLLSVVVNQSIIFFIALFYLRKEKWFKIDNFTFSIDKIQLKLLSGFALISVLSTAVAPISSIIIRNNIISQLSLFDAGLYEFAFRVSTAVIIFFSLTISTYYLPRISEISIKKELFLEIKNTYLIVIPIVVFLLMIIYLCRDLIILILASTDFKLAAPLFIWVLVGVFFKICTQIVGFVFLSKAKIKSVIAIEIIYNVVLTLTSIYFVRKFGLVGSVIAFCLCNIVYFIGVQVMFYYNFIKPKNILC